MIVFYMDASSVKLNRTNMSEATCLFYATVVAYTCYDWTINKDEFNKLQKYNKIMYCEYKDFLVITIRLRR